MASMSNWFEVIILTVLFVLMFGSVVGSMNYTYLKSNDASILGINTTKSEIINAQNSMQSKVTEGETSFTSAWGLSLVSSWGLIKQVSGIIWNFFTGGFIEQLCTDWLMLPSEVGLMFRLLYFASVIFIILYVLFKVPV